MAWKRRSKFGAIPTTVDGIRFPSKAEARRYQELKLLSLAHQVCDLELQPKYPITINGINICTVILDFRYYDKVRGKMVVEDVKGGEATKTPVSRLKHKLLFALHGVVVQYV